MQLALEPRPPLSADDAALRRAFSTTMTSTRPSWPVGPSSRPVDVEVVAAPPWRRWRRVLATAVVALGFGVVGGVASLRAMPRAAELRVEASSPAGPLARAEVYVDGVKRCDAVPCRVADVEPGVRRVIVRPSGSPYLAPIAVRVEAGREHVAFVALDAPAPLAAESP